MEQKFESAKLLWIVTCDLEVAFRAIIGELRMWIDRETIV